MPTKQFLIRFSFAVLVFVFTLYLAILAAFPAFFNINSFKNKLESDFYKQTGLILGIEQIIIKPSLSPYINISAYHAGILYPDKKEFLKVKDIDIKIKVFPILRRKIHVEKIVLNRPILAFSIDSNGKTSFDKYLTLNIIPESNFSGFTFEKNIPIIELNRYKLKVYDKKYSIPFLLEGEKLKTEPLALTYGMKIISKGVISHKNNEYLKYDIDIDSNIPDTKTRLFSNNPFRYIIDYQIKGDISSRIKLKKFGKETKKTGSVSVDKLSFKVNNKVIANNHIDFDICDNKIKINANLKTDDINKIEIFGNCETGKNRNINLTVRAESADLQTIKSTAETILNAFNIKNNLQEYSIFGKVNLNFKIKSNFKTLKSEGIAEIFNASIKSKNYQYNISGINSKINFSNNKIKIEPSKMYIYGTPVILTGNIDSKTNLDILIKSDNLDASKFAKIFFTKKLQDKISINGKTGFSAKINGTAKSPKTIIEVNFSDFLIKNKNIFIVKFQKGKLIFSGTPDKPQGTIDLNNVLIIPKNFSNSFRSNSMKLIFDSEKIEIPKTTLLIDEVPIDFSGKIMEYQKNPEYDLSINGKLSGKSIYEYFKQNFDSNNIKAVVKGNIGVNAKIKGNNKTTSIKADFKSDANNYISALVIKELLNNNSTISVDAVKNGDDIYLKDLTVNKENLNGSFDKIISINGKIKNIKEPIFDKLKIVIPKAMTFSVEKLKNSEITIQSDLILNGKTNTPEIKGFLDVKSIKIPEYKIKSDVNKFVFENKYIKILIPKLEIGKSKLDISAGIIPDSNGKYTVRNFNLTADYFDLDEFNEIFSETQNNPVYPGISLPILIPSGKAAIKIFKTGGLQAENVNCNISLANNILKMTNISGNAYKGIIFGKSEYDFLHTSTLSEINGKNADIRSLIKALTGKNDEMSGLIDYKIKISSIGTKRNQQQRTAKGYIEFTAVKGTLGPLGQFEHFLYAQNLISQSIIKMTTISVIKAVRPQNTGMYTIAKGNIELNKGNAYLKPLTVEGPNMSLYVTGKINLLNDLADVKIYGRISQQVERVLGDLANPVPQTIMSSSSETSIGNLFYEEYNTTISKAITDAIPKLNPETGLSSRLFAVVIQGSADSVKAVKSFKWITGTTKAPIPKSRHIEQQIQLEEKIPEEQNNSLLNTNPINKVIPQKQIQQENVENKPENVMQNKETIPDFMKALPDNFN